MPATNKRAVRLTHPDRVVFPDGITKRDVADYYRQVSGYMLPHLHGRPLVMERFPDGIDGDGFYQKNASDYFPDWIERIEVVKEGGTVEHVVCNDVETLIYLVNQGCVTFHTWLSCKDTLDKPDLLVFDLDPQRDDDFDSVRQSALHLRELLDELGLACFVQTTGSRGLHIDVPLDRTLDFDEVRGFAREVAGVLVQQEPKRFTTEHRKSKRGDRIFIDTLRNAYAQTAVAPYSLRAKPGAPAATPIEWSEVERGKLHPDDYGIANMARRLEKQGDVWAGMRDAAQALEGAIESLRSKA